MNGEVALLAEWGDSGRRLLGKAPISECGFFDHVLLEPTLAPLSAEASGRLRVSLYIV